MTSLVIVIGYLKCPVITSHITQLYTVNNQFAELRDIQWITNKVISLFHIIALSTHWTFFFIAACSRSLSPPSKPFIYLTTALLSSNFHSLLTFLSSLLTAPLIFSTKFPKLVSYANVVSTNSCPLPFISSLKPIPPKSSSAAYMLELLCFVSRLDYKHFKAGALPLYLLCKVPVHNYTIHCYINNWNQLSATYLKYYWSNKTPHLRVRKWDRQQFYTTLDLLLLF